MSRVREPAGRSRVTFCRPEEPSGNLKVRSLTSTVGAVEGNAIVREMNVCN